MQTFLPYPNMEKSLQCLDYKRLGKQRVEASQILKALTNPNYGWQHHPAVKMWRGCEGALTLYMNTAIHEWIKRGYNNTMPIVEIKNIYVPEWWGDPRFHDSHKSSLLRKDFDHYSQFNWDVPLDLPYYWPEPSTTHGR